LRVAGGGALGAGLVLVLAVVGCAGRQRPESAAVEPGRAGGGADEADALALQARAAVTRSEKEKDAPARAALVREAMEAAQRCEKLAPATPRCDYALAIAMGVKARLHLSTAIHSLPAMVKLLRAAAAGEPALDFGGPNRVLAILLVRAPNWPLGPGDAEAGLESARRAVALAPDYAPNHTALAEALHVTEDVAGSAAAARRAMELARKAVEAGQPEAARWLGEAERFK
jgi:hypothetical protein